MYRRRFGRHTPGWGFLFSCLLRVQFSIIISLPVAIPGKLLDDFFAETRLPVVERVRFGQVTVLLSGSVLAAVYVLGRL